MRLHEDHAAAAPRRSIFFKVRVAVLLAILAGVLLHAWRDVRSRSLRNDWTRTLDVAVVLVGADLDPALATALRDRAAALEDVLADELARRDAGAPRPFDIEVHEAAVALAPPVLRADGDGEPGVIDAARYAWDLHAFTSALDDAARLDRRYDTRIYVLARPPSRARRRDIEGIGEQGGRVGVIEVELDETMIDFALFVAAHELMHTLGATDRYDAAGEPLIPDGLAEPGREPRFPQSGTEVMARHRAIARGRSVPPDALDELVVGDVTAREIGWLPR